MKEHDATNLPRRWSENLMGFLFPSETDKWLGILRIGLGLQVAVYALFLRSDWHYLFASTGKGLVSRKLGEALRPSTAHSFQSLAGLLLLAVTLTSARTLCFPLPGPVCFVWDCCYYSAFSLARLRSPPGFFTSAQRKAVGYSHTAPITS